MEGGIFSFPFQRDFLGTEYTHSHMGPKSGPAPWRQPWRPRAAQEAYLRAGGQAGHEGREPPSLGFSDYHASPCPHLSAECVLRTHL